MIHGRIGAIAGVCLITVLSTSALGGPVIMGGDDLTDHGFGDGTANFDGWLYIEKAIQNLNAAATRTGPFTSDIAALGAPASPGCPGDCPAGSAGAAIDSVAAVLGLTVTHYEGSAALTSFFTDLGNASVNHRILWIAGDQARNDLDAAEGTALAANAGAIKSFVASGGGLMAHGAGDAAYGWLDVALPGLIAIPGCQAKDATLTAAGTAAFPGLLDDNVATGPCHATFSGEFGLLKVLVTDGQHGTSCVGGIVEGNMCASNDDCSVGGECHAGFPMIIGGDASTVFTNCGDNAVNSIKEECDGTDDAACPGRCTPPTYPFACRCSLCGTAPDPACIQPSVGNSASVKIKDHPDDKKDKMSWKWSKGAATELQFENPEEDTTYQLCVYDSTPSLVASAIMPAGGLCGSRKKPKPCWKEAAKGFNYGNSALTPTGIKTMKLKSGAGTKARLKIAGKGAPLLLPSTFPMSTPVTIQLKNSTTPLCWQAVYQQHVKKNSSTPKREFNAKAND